MALSDKNTPFQRNAMRQTLAGLPVWSPSGERDNVFAFDPSRSKIRHIEGPQKKSHDIVDRLKATWLGRFYISHLKRYAFIRWMAIWSWRTLYPVYLNLMANFAIYFRYRKAKRWRGLVSLSEFVKKEDIEKIKLADAELVETPAPAVYPTSDQGCLKSPHEKYLFPEAFVAEISNGVVYGGTNLTLVGDRVICHDLYDFERDYTSEELHGRTLIAPKSKRMRWLLHDDIPERVATAASFVDACAPNYAHWMTEVLPRIALFCAEQRFKDVPIVVNEGLHKNIMESLFLVAGAEREVIALPIGRALSVSALYLTSVAGYVPFERRKTKIVGHSHGMFSPRAFELLRNKMAALVEQHGRQAWPEKIFLHRNSGYRKVINVDDLEREMVSRGYVVVEPERLTFLQQIQLFSHVKHMIASSGSALANMLFAPKDAKIVILMNKHPDTSYWYWQNMACACGNTVCYVLGNSNGAGNSGIHADFVIDIDHLISSIEGEI